MPNTRILHAMNLHERDDCNSVVELSRAGIESTSIRLIWLIVCQSGTVNAMLEADDSKTTGPMNTYHFVRPRTPIWISAMDFQSRLTSTLFYDFVFSSLFQFALPRKNNFFLEAKFTKLCDDSFEISSENNKRTVHTQISFILLRSRSFYRSRYRWTHTHSLFFFCRCRWLGVRYNSKIKFLFFFVFV